MAGCHAGIEGCRFSSPSGVEVGSFSYTLAFSRLTSVLSRCQILAWLVSWRMFEGGLALGGLSGCSPLSVLPPRFPLGCLLPFWVASAAAWGLASHFFFPYLFLWSRVAPWFLVGVLQRFSPPGGFLLQFFLEGNLPPLWRWRVWMAESSRPIRSSGRLPGACLILSSSPLALHGVVSTSRCACLGLRPFGKCV